MCPRSQRVWRWRERSIDAYGGGERDSDGERGCINPAPSPSPADRVEVSSTVQLVDAGSGGVTTLYESRTTMAFMARFTGSQVLVWAQPDLLQFELDGTVSRLPLPADVRRPRRLGDRGGARRWTGARCGSLSPDNRLMLYTVIKGTRNLPSGEEGPPFPMRGLSDINTTGEKRIVPPGLVACGGCDGRYGPRWSPDSGYVAYAETGGDQRRFLTDAQSWTRNDPHR